MGYKAALRVWRGDAGAGELADYQVEVNEGEVVLDVLHRLQATQASDLAIRWNCKAGKCGSSRDERAVRRGVRAQHRRHPVHPLTAPNLWCSRHSSSGRVRSCT